MRAPSRLVSRHDNPLSATLSGIVDLMTPQRPVGTLAPRDRLDGLTCLVTGASSGLGKAIAIGLARRGGRVIIAGRTGEARVRGDIVAASGNPAVELEQLDLADLRSVDGFLQRLEARGAVIDRCILNAGVVPGSSRPTEQGFEEMFAVNYLANFALVTGLLRRNVIRNQTFARSPKPMSRGAGLPRIVFVSSEAHRSAKPVNPESLGVFRDYDLSGSLAEYSRNKLLLTTFFCELARHLKGDVAVHALCPGAVNTNIAREAPAWSKPLLRLIFAAAFRSPEAAAWAALYLSCSRSIEGRTGIYLHVRTRKPVSPTAENPEAGHQLWQASEQLLRNVRLRPGGI